MDAYLTSFVHGYLEQIAYSDDIELPAFESEPDWVASVFQNAALFLLDAKPKLMGIEPFEAGTMFALTRMGSTYGFSKLPVNRSKDFLVRRTMVLSQEKTRLSKNNLRTGSETITASPQIEEWLFQNRKNSSCQLAETHCDK